jgi:CheY-like chemotaxis protein
MRPIALVVEKDPGTRKLLEVVLSRLGFDVDVVAIPSDALVLLDTIDYDLLLVELLFPAASGLEVLSWLEANRPGALSRAAIVSGAPPRELGRAAAKWPSVAIVRKPFELTEVIELVRSRSAGEPRRKGSVLEELARRAVRAGAKAGVVVSLAGGSVEPIATFGYKPVVLEPFIPLTFDADVPLCAAMRSREAVWLASLTIAAKDYPALVDVWRNNGSRALCAVPLFRDERIAGAVGFSFREPRMFGERERETFASIAALALDLL